MHFWWRSLVNGDGPTGASSESVLGDAAISGCSERRTNCGNENDVDDVDEPVDDDDDDDDDDDVEEDDAALEAQRRVSFLRHVDAAALDANAAAVFDAAAAADAEVEADDGGASDADSEAAAIKGSVRQRRNGDRLEGRGADFGAGSDSRSDAGGVRSSLL